MFSCQRICESSKEQLLVMSTPASITRVVALPQARLRPQISGVRRFAKASVGLCLGQNREAQAGGRAAMSRVCANDADLECAVCRHVYTNPVTLLGCRHAFCEQCVRQLYLRAIAVNGPPVIAVPDPAACSSGDGDHASAAGADDDVPSGHTRLSCPVCRQPSLVSAAVGTASFPRNLQLAGLCEKTRQQQASPACANCKTTAATVDCEGCAASFCDECFDQIHQPNFMKSHKKAEVGAVANKQRQERRQERLRGCAAHPNKEVDVYCTTDNDLVCSLCAQFGAHKGHECMTLEQAAAQLGSELDQISGRLTERLDQLRQAAETLQTKAAQVTSLTSSRGRRCTDPDKWCGRLLRAARRPSSRSRTRTSR